VRRPRIAWALAAGCVALLGVSAFARRDRAAHHHGDDAPWAAAAAEQAALPVHVVPVVRGALVQTIAAAGEAAAARQVTVHAQVTGIVRSVHAGTAERVSQGAALVALDDVDASLAVRQARASAARAHSQYRDLVMLEDPSDVPAVRAARDSAARLRSGLAAAELDVERAELELRRTRVLAPFAGRVANVRVVAGQWVRAGDELLTIARLQPVRVDVPVLEADLAHLAPGRAATLAFAALPGERFAARVASIDPLVDPATRSAIVSLQVTDATGRVRPGMYARADIQARRLENRVLVPRAALLERDGRPVVFVLRLGERATSGERHGRAEWRYVRTGAENDSLVEIVPGGPGAGVRPGEWVLVDGHATLVHDARVRAVVPRSRP
jgi:membrane fusion protein (multidrug efflux system)